MSAVTSTQRMKWLKQRLTGSRSDGALVTSIIDFVLYPSPIDIEKLRRSLYHQVLMNTVFKLCKIVQMNVVVRLKSLMLMV